MIDYTKVMQNSKTQQADNIVILRVDEKMSFKKLPDNRGMIYVPECLTFKKKNPCLDCFSCQWCGNERCRVCKGKNPLSQKQGNTRQKK